MARVVVKLYASLRRYVGGVPSVEVDVEPGQTIADVLRQLDVPADQARIIFVNHRAGNLSQPLTGGERIGIFPAIGGG